MKYKNKRVFIPFIFMVYSETFTTTNIHLLNAFLCYANQTSLNWNYIILLSPYSIIASLSIEDFFAPCIILSVHLGNCTLSQFRLNVKVI